MNNKSVLSQRKNQYGEKNLDPLLMPTRDSVYRLKSNGTGKPRQKRMREGFSAVGGQIYRLIHYAGSFRQVRVIFVDEQK